MKATGASAVEASISQKLGVQVSELFRLKSQSGGCYLHVSPLQIMITKMETRIPTS